MNREDVLRGLIAACAIGIAVPAQATRGDTRTITVSYADLDLASHEERMVLDRRLRRAAAEVCAVAQPAASLKPYVVPRCYRASLTQARRDADAAAVGVRLARK